MKLLPALLALTFVSSVAPAKDKKAYNEISADTVTIDAKAYTDPQAIKQLVGSDLGGHYIVIEVTLTPKGPKPLNVRTNDFILIAENDGDRSQPQDPAEIAAQDTLVLKRGSSIVGSYGEETGSIWSGVGMGRSRGSKKSDQDKDSKDKQPTPEVKHGEKDDSLKAALTQKSLPEKETTQPVTGLLYFPMEKKKLKDLALLYSTPNGKLRLYFK